MKKLLIAGFALLFSAGAMTAPGVAHEGATGIVKERMDSMTTIGAAMKKLGGMFRGGISYNADVVSAQAQLIADEAGEALIAMFPEGSDGHVSRALPVIWTQMDDFKEKANLLKSTADSLVSAGGLQAEAALYFDKLADQCGACHKVYRMPK